MAIQVRRGNYADLDISKLVQGEPFVTLDEAPTGGYYVGMAIAPNNVVRLATRDELEDIKTDCEHARDEAEQSASDAATSETNAAISEQNAATYWGYVEDATSLITPEVTIDYTTGELIFEGSQMLFWLDETTGYLMWSVEGA